VQGAIDSITDASEDNPYLVWVAPGEYLESVTMKPYVHLQGAGQETTVISSTVTSEDFPPINATLVMTSHVTVRDLQIVNNGAGELIAGLIATAGVVDAKVTDVKVMAHGNSEQNFAIFTIGSSLTFESVTASSQNGTLSNTGMYNDEGSEVELVDCSAAGTGGYQAYGIYNFGDSFLTARNTDAQGSNANHNRGLVNQNGAYAIIEDGSFIADGPGGTSARGIVNDNGSSLQAVHISVYARSSDYNQGVANTDDASASIIYSVLEGDDESVYSNGTLYIRFSQLKGSTGYYSGTYDCTAMIMEETFFVEECP
jgi:hypothetical protein